MKKKKITGLHVAIVAVVQILFLGAFWSCNSSISDNNITSQSIVSEPQKHSETKVTQTKSANETTKETNKEVTKQSTTETVKEVVKETMPQVSMGERNALAKAKEYLRVMAFSYNSLVRQLEFEGFTQDECAYGVDNCGANWNEQAVRKANEYLKSGSFSRQGLINQLLFEGFSQEQAEYGVSKVGY